MMKVTVWNEYRHEKENKTVSDIYPEGIHQTIAAFLQEAGYGTETATLDEPEHGLTDAVLNETDVLVWWGHKAHDEVQDEIAEKVKQRVLDGDRKSTRLNSSHVAISYAVFCLKKIRLCIW